MEKLVPDYKITLISAKKNQASEPNQTKKISCFLQVQQVSQKA
jgi:hypothetical protein